MTRELSRWPGPWKNDDDAMEKLDGLSKKHGSGYMVLLACLSQHDPMSLIPMAPPDEYAHEAEMIWEQLGDLCSEEELAAVARTVFPRESLRVEFPDWKSWSSAIALFAHDFWTRWQAFQLHPYTPKWRAGAHRVKAQIEVPVKG
jgi:hypothetical protein